MHHKQITLSLTLGINYRNTNSVNIKTNSSVTIAPSLIFPGLQFVTACIDTQ